MGRQDAATPFRPAGKGGRSYRVRAGGRLEVRLADQRKQVAAYHVIPLSTDFGRAAFRLHRLDGSGQTYDVLLGDQHESCTCPGWCYRERCKHLDACRVLLDLGILAPAPASAAGDGGGDGGRAV